MVQMATNNDRSVVLIEMISIKQNLVSRPLPDFRNFGVVLRIVVGVNMGAMLFALAQIDDLAGFAARYVALSAWVQPLLLANVALLSLGWPLLKRLPSRSGDLLVVLMAIVSSILYVDSFAFLGFDAGGFAHFARAAIFSASAAITLLIYFDLRSRAFSPAVAEARLQALTARIRPHFLFNSLNAVLSLIRSDPRRAENALEELAELFRVLMRDQRDLLPLADEIALCRQYLDLEKLRLGERLQVEWDIVDVPSDVKVPPLMLQPLLENAIYHGIEPSADPGVLRIRFSRKGSELRIDLTNPLCAKESATKGAHMALANVRERLALYYDLEARLETKEKLAANGRGEFRVRIALPCHGSMI